MSGSDQDLTDRERELLRAVREVLDIPRPAPGHHFGWGDTLMERVPRLLGATDGFDHEACTFRSIMRALRRIAAYPLKYEPNEHYVAELAASKAKIS